MDVRDHLQKCLLQYEIDSDQIIYVGTAKSEKRVYVPESAELLRLFFENLEIPDGCVVFSDNGHSFFDEGNDVLLELGFAKHVQYPAAVHQYISPNDNRLHGAAKIKWRNVRIDYSDDVTACCSLLHFLNESISEVPTWFDSNMQLGTKTTDLGAVERMIKGPSSKESKFHRKCLREFRTFQYGDARGSIPDAPKGLDSGLDGLYWEKK